MPQQHESLIACAKKILPLAVENRLVNSEKAQPVPYYQALPDTTLGGNSKLHCAWFIADGLIDDIKQT